jgi:hypothetical protein
MGSYSREGGPQTDKTPAAKSLYRSIVLFNDILHSISLIFLRNHLKTGTLGPCVVHAWVGVYFSNPAAMMLSSF